jgi:hypothetical protein
MRSRVLGPPLVALGAAGFVACLVCLYSGMRDVMRTSGGFCANGGAYVIAQHCTSGDVRLVMVGILGALVSAGVVAVATGWLDGPVLGISLTMWSAMFGALGWNFIQPPRAHSSGGWIVSGVAFWALALGGLIPVAVMVFAWLRRGGKPEPASSPLQPLVRAVVPTTSLTDPNWWTSQ